MCVFVCVRGGEGVFGGGFEQQRVATCPSDVSCPVYGICPGAGAWLSSTRRIVVCVLQG